MLSQQESVAGGRRNGHQSGFTTDGHVAEPIHGLRSLRLTWNWRSLRLLIAFGRVRTGLLPNHADGAVVVVDVHHVIGPRFVVVGTKALVAKEGASIEAGEVEPFFLMDDVHPMDNA